MSASKKVLIVEDEFVLYDELVEFFKEKGFKIAGNDDNKSINNYSDAIKVLHEEEPDFAVLDVKIKGNKDGIELGDYIRRHFNIPIIFLSAYGNYENIERARKLAPERFIIKHDKPINKEQLWVDITMITPQMEINRKRREAGMFMKVKEINLLQLKKKINATYQQPSDPIDLKTFVKWDEIKMIISSNKISNNTILLYTLQPDKGYFYRSTLDEIETSLPDYFTRFNSGTIVNVKAITAEGKTADVFYLNDVQAKIGEKYKVSATQKIKLYMGNKL